MNNKSILIFCLVIFIEGTIIGVLLHDRTFAGRTAKEWADIRNEEHDEVSNKLGVCKVDINSSECKELLYKYNKAKSWLEDEPTPKPNNDSLNMKNGMSCKPIGNKGALDCQPYQYEFDQNSPSEGIDPGMAQENFPSNN